MVVLYDAAHNGDPTVSSFIVGINSASQVRCCIGGNLTSAYEGHAIGIDRAANHRDVVAHNTIVQGHGGVVSDVDAATAQRAEVAVHDAAVHGHAGAFGNIDATTAGLLVVGGSRIRVGSLSVRPVRLDGTTFLDELAPPGNVDAGTPEPQVAYDVAALKNEFALDVDAAAAFRHASSNGTRTFRDLVRGRRVRDGQLRALADDEDVGPVVGGIQAFLLSPDQAAADDMSVQVDGELLAFRNDERGFALIRTIILFKGYGGAVACRIDQLLQERPASLHETFAVRVCDDRERLVGREEDRRGVLLPVVRLETRCERAEALLQRDADFGVRCQRSGDRNRLAFAEVHVVADTCTVAAYHGRAQKGDFAAGNAAAFAEVEVFTLCFIAGDSAAAEGYVVLGIDSATVDRAVVGDSSACDVCVYPTSTARVLIGINATAGATSRVGHNLSTGHVEDSLVVDASSIAFVLSISGIVFDSATLKIKRAARGDSDAATPRQAVLISAIGNVIRYNAATHGEGT